MAAKKREAELLAIDFENLLQGNDGTHNWLCDCWQSQPDMAYMRNVITDTLWYSNDVYTKAELEFMLDQWLRDEPKCLFEIIGAEYQPPSPKWMTIHSHRGSGRPSHYTVSESKPEYCTFEDKVVYELLYRDPNELYSSLIHDEDEWVYWGQP